MFDGMPADWLSWSLGGGLCFIFLWLISVPPVRAHVGEARANDARSRSHARKMQTCRNLTRRAERID